MEIISTGKSGGATVVSVKGRMDAASAPDFEKNMQEMIDGGQRAFAVDLSELDYISSAGLRAILSIAKRLKTLNGNFLIASLRGPVKEVFEISGFSSIIPIYDSVDAALS
ncbi:MAG: STAS domain-containing protein [Deltaproteobacteria bacterium]|nr:STAS domain-containing protein [Deltaproteobacteria bacterium]